jgi:hypothetical protein
MSLKIEQGEIEDAIKLVKKECVGVDEMSPYEINRLAVEIVMASNVYDSAALISESIDYLNEN